ncbi:MAG: hypothetical protein SGPRY_007965 [Prymnesium sp.]
MPKTTAIEEDDGVPFWDTTPITMRKWLISLPEYLESENTDYVTWWEQGYCMATHQVASPTTTHSIALRDGAVRIHSSDQPIDVNIFVGAGAPCGSRALSATDEKRFSVAPEFCRRIDRQLANSILATVSVRAVRHDILRRCNQSGLTLLNMLHACADEVGPYANTAIAGKLQKLLNTGPESRTVAAFNRWREEWDSWNHSQPIDAIVPPSFVASRYEAAARRLGEPLAERITNEIRLMQARGDPEKTVTAINQVLGDYEAELITTSDTGGAMKMTTRGPCRYCGELHWNADCPKMAEKKSKKKAARAAKLAIKQKGNEPSREPDDSSKELKKPTMGAANLVTTGEMLISEEFFSGGEQSVALASGGGMVSLKGVKSKDKPSSTKLRQTINPATPSATISPGWLTAKVERKSVSPYTWDSPSSSPDAASSKISKRKHRARKSTPSPLAPSPSRWSICMSLVAGFNLALLALLLAIAAHAFRSAGKCPKILKLHNRKRPSNLLTLGTGGGRARRPAAPGEAARQVANRTFYHLIVFRDHEHQGACACERIACLASIPYGEPPRLLNLAWYGLSSTALRDRVGPTLPLTPRAYRSLSTVDSGYVWHVVKDERLLINKRPCDDTMYGADGIECACIALGDLPIVATDSSGKRVYTLISNVRCVPDFICPLLSVRQLWKDTRIDSIFRDENMLIVPGDPEPTIFPFSEAEDLLYRWEVQALGSSTQAAKGLPRAGPALSVGPIHSGNSNSHIDILSHADAASMPLPRSNIVHVSSALRALKPTLPGLPTRTLLGTPSLNLPARSALVATAMLSSILAKRFGADESFTVAALLHTDNAGEFLSHEFGELLDKEKVAQSTCPPHVHSLNGVAERAIRSIFSMVRSNMVASGAKAGLWLHLVSHSLDVLNPAFLDKVGLTAVQIDNDAKKGAQTLKMGVLRLSASVII